MYIFNLLFIIYYYLILDQDNCQDMSAMAPLNDLLGQTFLIETNEQPLFVNSAQVKTIVIIPLLFDIDIFFFLYS